MRLTSSLAGWLALVAINALAPIVTAPAAAQVRVATLDELRLELSAGDVVSIVGSEPHAIQGRLTRVGDADLGLLVKPAVAGAESGRRLEVAIPYSALRSLERPRDSAKNGALIGAGVVGGFVLAMFTYALTVDRNELDEWGPQYLAAGGIMTGIGAFAGWVIDRAHSKRHIRFAPLSTASLETRRSSTHRGGRIRLPFPEQHRQPDQEDLHRHGQVGRQVGSRTMRPDGVRGNAAHLPVVLEKDERPPKRRPRT